MIAFSLLQNNNQYSGWFCLAETAPWKIGKKAASGLEKIDYTLSKVVFSYLYT